MGRRTGKTVELDADELRVLNAILAKRHWGPSQLAEVANAELQKAGLEPVHVTTVTRILDGSTKRPSEEVLSAMRGALGLDDGHGTLVTDADEMELLEAARLLLRAGGAESLESLVKLAKERAKAAVQASELEAKARLIRLGLANSGTATVAAEDEQRHLDTPKTLTPPKPPTTPVRPSPPGHRRSR